MFSSARVIAIFVVGLFLLLKPSVMAYAEVLVLQAESMPTKTSGEISKDGSGWAINDNGYISQPVTFTKGKFRIEVLARGTNIGDAWPVMQIRVNGTAFGDPITISSNEWSTYSVEGSLDEGTSDVRVELTNSYFDEQANSYRLLEVDRLSIEQQSDDQPSGNGGKVPWRLGVVLMGPIDPVEQAETPIKEAISFIEARTRFVFDVQYVTTTAAYDYTPYALGTDNDGDGVGDEVAYLMMGWNIPQPIIDSLPVSSSYLFLYTMNGLRPLQAGSALGVKYGISKGGKPRPYSSIPADQPWYVNNAIEGFSSHAAQILTHEIINTIQGKIEAAPYNCAQLTATWGLPPAQFESDRLLKLDEACYQKLEDKMDDEELRK